MKSRKSNFSKIKKSQAAYLNGASNTLHKADSAYQKLLSVKNIRSPKQTDKTSSSKKFSSSIFVLFLIIALNLISLISVSLPGAL